MKLKLKNLKRSEIVLKSFQLYKRAVQPLVWISCQRLQDKLTQNVFSVSAVTSLRGRGTEPAHRSGASIPPNTLEQVPPPPPLPPPFPSPPLPSPSLRSRPPYCGLGVWGSALAPPAGPGGAQPPNGIWRISG